MSPALLADLNIPVNNQTTPPNRAVEPLLQETEDRYTLFPIKDLEIFMSAKRQLAAFWTVEEVDLAGDLRDWANLSDNEQTFVKNVLAFFAVSDGVVNENLVQRFSNEVQLPEARYAYSVQIMIESIHSEMYSLLIDTYVSDPAERERLFHPIAHIPSVKLKTTWAKKYIDDDEASFGTRLVAFASVEGIMFSSSFACIFYLKSKAKMVTGLALSNEFIARDEAEHVRFACLLFSRLINKPTEKEIHEIISGAVDVEKTFVNESLRVGLLGLSPAMMTSYVEFVADHLCTMLGVSIIYGTANPLIFMETISLQGKTNFFESRVSQYQMRGVVSRAEMAKDGDMAKRVAEERVLNIDDDF